MLDQPINQIGPLCQSSPVRAKVVGCKSLLPGQVLLKHLDPILKHHGLPPTANRLSHYGGGESYSSADVQSAYSTAQPTKLKKKYTPNLPLKHKIQKNKVHIDPQYTHQKPSKTN